METTVKYGEKDLDQTGMYQDLSTHLYRVLYAVGVSEEVREGYREQSTVKEILVNAVNDLTKYYVSSFYIFGSKYEGTATKGLASDIDVLFCDERNPVVEKIDDAPLCGISVLMITEETKPGYVNLQILVNRTKQTINETDVTNLGETDHQQCLLLKHVYNIFNLPNVIRHGPADKIPILEGQNEWDIVLAFRCRTIPSFADEWLYRPRPYQWPSQEQLQRMGSYGCFFVGVGHPESLNKESEWRISFSLQERELMYSLNPTQHKCYVLLKMIKKDIIQPRVGKSLSSYHCKTCIFHLAEIRGVERWTQHNLVSCILECLRLLMDWVKQGNCPNYFIKDENMFDKLDQSTLTSLSLVLQELLSNDANFLYEIKCDDLGMLLVLSKLDRRLEEKKLRMKRLYISSIKHHIMMFFLIARSQLCRYIENTQIRSERLSRANHIMQYLEHTTIISEQKPSDVRIALDMLIQYIRLVIVMMKCSNKLAQINREKDDVEIQALSWEIGQCKLSRLISSRLIISSLYIQYDKLDSCQKILYNCETSLTLETTSLCACYNYRRYMNLPPMEEKDVENLSFEEFRRKCTVACLVLLPSEASLVLPALRYEMYRSVYTPQGSKEENKHFWFDWIAVDAKVYMYFLQYILYAKTNNLAYKNSAIDKLVHVIYSDSNLGHRETALNLLGWIYTQEKRIQDAFECFCCSLSIQPLHNAAKWHMALLLHSLMNRSTQTIYKRKLYLACDDFLDDKKRKVQQ